MTAEEAVTALLWRKRYNVALPAKLFRRELFDGVRFSPNSKYDDIEITYKLFAGADRVAYDGESKYTFCRHESNNSAWTTNHSLLTPETLDEYLHVFRERTQYLSELFPGNARLWRYFELSFMLSMTEKVSRLNLAACYPIRDAMLAELRGEFDELLRCKWIQDFEKGWLRKYAGYVYA